MTQCHHCGSDVDRRAAPPVAPAAGDARRLARGTGAQDALDPRGGARLDRVVTHGDYPAAMGFGPPTPSLLDLILPLVMVVTGAHAIARTLDVLGVGVAGAVIGVLGLGWFAVAAALARSAWRDRGGLLRRQVALVVAERVAERPLREGHRAVELQLEGGGREALPCHPGLAAALGRGDVGIAYVQRGRLIAFCRFDFSSSS